MLQNFMTNWVLLLIFIVLIIAFFFLRKKIKKKKVGMDGIDKASDDIYPLY
jgi:hypothetical protein|tara:strand:+ start:56 stop:208 length:153 start_codon:yes stop_codon:yes gene_type:complete